MILTSHTVKCFHHNSIGIEFYNDVKKRIESCFE